ncbi:MAG: hypothetical protein D6729_18690 [Deltaproteobacteria bacterium]|nr:MAG: hypothetical protein D6729_18690 [Deltaproteobacteria bacterium]
MLLPSLLLLPGPAKGSPLSILGSGARGIGMGEAQVAAADDYTATFYNPALLTRRLRVTFGAGFQLVKPNMSIVEEAPFFDDGNQPVFPSDFVQWNLGVIFPLGGKVKNRVVLGLGASLPNGFLVRVKAIDSKSPSFVLYEFSVRKITLAPCFAFLVTDWLSVGAGLQVLADFGGTGARVDVDLFARKVDHREVLVDLVPRQSLVAGLTLGPFAGLTAGISFRQELGLDFSLPAYIVLEDVGVLDLKLRGTTLWTPNEVTAGAAWTPEGTGLTLAFDLTWAQWSRAPSPELLVELDSGGPVLDGLGLGEALDLCSDRVVESQDGKTVCRPRPPGFVDVLMPKLGVEYRVNDTVTLRGGTWLRPTPVPDQVGKTNFLDATTLHLSLGASFTFSDPLEIFSEPVTFDAATQAAFLKERTVDKGSDGRPEYRFGGTLFQLAASLRYQF